MMEEDSGIADYHLESDDLTRLLDIWVNREVVLVDAIQSRDCDPGEILETRDLTQWQEEASVHCSSHSVSLKQAMDLASILEKRPATVYFIGLQGKQWELGQELSIPVRDSFPLVKQRIREYLSAR